MLVPYSLIKWICRTTPTAGLWSRISQPFANQQMMRYSFAVWDGGLDTHFSCCTCEMVL